MLLFSGLINVTCSGSGIDSLQEKIKITKPTEMAVLITNALLSSIAVLISLAFSEITIKPKSFSSLFTFLTVVTLN